MHTFSMTPLDLLIRERIGDAGPMPYDEFVELALYHDDHGFYSLTGKAGRRGDFITSPEVGPLFGALVARALDAEWDRLGQPDVFTVIDYGAGPGTLARTIDLAKPRCQGSLRYVAVEQSIAQRAEHPEWVLSLPQVSDAVVGDGLVGVVIANELLDNLPFTPVRRVDGELRRHEVAVGEGGELTTVIGARLTVDEAALFDDDVGAAVLQAAAASWLKRRWEDLASGSIWILDYARANSGDVEIRTYAEHGRAGDPLDAVGTKDITVDVDLAQLQRAVRAADSIVTQADWLRGLGIDELVAEGKEIWEASAAIGSLDALRGRSRIREADALLDPNGLGGFDYACWRK